jgi:hypothetical protein
MSSKTKIPGKLAHASISDVHMGHHTTPTEHIVGNLRKAFPDNAETGKLDIIWFGGDFFDRLMNLPDDNVGLLQVWIVGFLRMCGRRKIKVRILEGTKSHDWAQNKLFVQLMEQAAIDVDMKYIDTLSIEFIEDFEISVLYVPDDWRPNPDDTWIEILQLLQANSLEKVDYAIVHGSFDHQLPPVVKTPKHLGERFLSIVKHYIFIGHVHIASQRDRILANGSFDRISHGEEAPKGHWRVTVGGPDGDELNFVENKGAQLYKTINCAALTADEALEKLKVVADYPAGSFVRVEASRGDAILSNMDSLRKSYPHIKSWSVKEVKEKDVQAKLLTDMRSSFTEVNITRSNIAEMVMARVATLTTDPRLLARCRERLEEYAQ